MTTTHPNSGFSWLRRLAILTCLVTGCVFTARAMTPSVNATPGVTSSTPDTTPPVAKSSGHQTKLVTKNIEDVQLGQRVVGRNPLREQTQPASNIDPQTWRAVRLNMIQGGVAYDLAFLLNTNHRCRSGFRASTKKPGTWRSVGLMGFDSGGCKRTTFNSMNL